MHGGIPVEVVLTRRIDQLTMQRVFIGIPIDKHAQTHINELIRPLKKSQLNIRWVPEDNRHMTLAFLGNVDPGPLAFLLQSFDQAYQHETQFQYRLSTLTRFPSKSGRIISLADIPTGPLNNLYQITLQLLQKCQLEFAQKTLRPHITLARIKQAKKIKTQFDQPTNIFLDINKIKLYRSTLTESGSQYTTLTETALRPLMG